MRNSTFSETDIKAALEVVLSSGPFSRSQRQTKFLRFIAEAYFRDAEHVLTSYEIAADCFHKDISQDPNDAYVRNIASQTRRSLSQLQDKLESQAHLLVSLSNKGYQLQFHAPDEHKASTPTSTEVLAAPTQAKPQPRTKLLPTLAIIPMTCRGGSGHERILGELISDAVNTSLAKSRMLNVVSRRSTQQFRHSNISTYELGGKLGADYVVDGSYYIHRDKVIVYAELSAVDSQEIIWADRFTTTSEAIVSQSDDLIDQLLQGLCQQLLEHEVQRALTTPLHSLQCHSLILGGVNIMHRGKPSDFRLAKDMLELAAERNPHNATPFAQLASWGWLMIVRDADYSKTIVNEDFITRYTEKALSMDSAHPVALTAKGLIKTHFKSDIQSARELYQKAISVSPNEASAMGKLAVSQIYTTSAETAIATAEKAIRTSPFDPELYFFHAAAATAAFAAKKYQLAIQHGEKSHVIFPNHLSNLRTLAAAYTAAGKSNNAQQAAKRIMQIDPDFSTEQYLKKSPFRQHPLVQNLADLLEKSGLPVRAENAHSTCS